MIKRRNVLLTMAGMFAAGITGVAKALGAGWTVDGAKPMPPVLPKAAQRPFSVGPRDPEAERMARRRRAIRDMQTRRPAPSSNYAAMRKHLGRVPTPQEMADVAARVEKEFGIGANQALPT
jgi:hypothetical protein